MGKSPDIGSLKRQKQDLLSQADRWNELAVVHGSNGNRAGATRCRAKAAELIRLAEGKQREIDKAGKGR